MAAPRRDLWRRLDGSYRQETHRAPPKARTPARQISINSPSSSARETKTIVTPTFMTTIARTQAKAQAFLRSAIASERAKRWCEAIEYYRRLINSLNKNNFPPQYVPGPTCKLLVFETYYHTGVAFQNMHNHREALEEFALALEMADIPKNACLVGCASGSFYQIPVLARRAYSFVKCDRIKEAIYDSTRAVHLDPSNPDVYCIRALVWNSIKEKRRALVDLNVSLRLNPSHVCTLILRGTILGSLTNLSSEQNKDHIKALALSWESMDFCDVEDFYNPKMSSFYDKFLWSLNAFHTITDINLFDGATIATHSAYITRHKVESKLRGSFRCGSVTKYSGSTALERRKTYIQAFNESNSGINVKKDSSSSATPVKPSSQQGSVKKELSSLTWGFENEERKSYDITGAKKSLKKVSDSAVDWDL